MSLAQAVGTAFRDAGLPVADPHAEIVEIVMNGSRMTLTVLQRTATTIRAAGSMWRQEARS